MTKHTHGTTKDDNAEHKHGDAAHDAAHKNDAHADHDHAAHAHECCGGKGDDCCRNDGVETADGADGAGEGCCGGGCGCSHGDEDDGHDHEHAHGGMPHTRVKVKHPGQTDIAEDGNLVIIHYTGTLDDGETFDTSRGRDPIEFTLGERAVIKGFEDGVRGLKKGEKKQIVIESMEAYGDVNPEMQQEVPREALGDIEPEVGMMLALQHPMAPQPIPCKIIAVTPEKVTIDLNHPLAGKRLHFDLEIVEIR